MEAKYIYTELDENSNKFWHITQDGSDVTTVWGRVGEAGQTKVKSFPSSYEAEDFYAKKIHEKERKGYTIQRTVGAAPTRVTNTNLGAIARKQIEHTEPETAKLIEFLVTRNIHAIEGATNIRYNETTGQLTTPLGVVTLEGLTEADDLLKQMESYIEGKRHLSPGFTRIVNQYMRIVPQNIGRQRVSATEIFGSIEKLKSQKVLLDTLRSVISDADDKLVTDAPVVFRTKLSMVDAKDPEFKRINDKFQKSMNRNHTSSRMTLKKVWKIEIAGAETAFETDGVKVGNIRELWHGTKDANLLSILKGGYAIPRNGGTMRITGRMFGDGVYFSDQSTKSLNYATSFWGGGGSQRSFMLLNDVAMGKGYEPSTSFSGGCRPGYDSTFAKPRVSGVMNNEMVVYRTSQIRPKYLCEFS